MKSPDASNGSPSLQTRLDTLGHGYPGRLIVVEGGDRSGRSTQVQLLAEWLDESDVPFVRTDWSTSPHISKAIHKAKAEGALRALTFSLFYAADFADRVSNVIIPALQRGEWVLADRYIYTAYARDTARGAELHWLETLYNFAPLPDLVLYLRVPPDITQQRQPSVPEKALDRYEAGLDLGLSSDPEASFRLYQQRVFDAFDYLAQHYPMLVLDGSQSVKHIQRAMRDAVRLLMRQSVGSSRAQSDAE